MKHELPELPYAITSLEPFLSAETLEYHYGAHHKSYVHKLNKLVTRTLYEDLSLEEIIVSAPPGALYQNAAQAWNHNFYWQCLSPDGGGMPGPQLDNVISQGFGSVDEFRQDFEAAALALFGSGWVWLVKNPNGRLAIRSCGDAGNPLTDNQTPLLVCDLWEHAYYIDYRNQRARYISAYWDLVNWDFVEASLSSQALYSPDVLQSKRNAWVVPGPLHASHPLHR